MAHKPRAGDSRPGPSGGAAPTKAARRRRAIVRILDEIGRPPSLREMARLLAKRGIRTSAPTVAKDLDALAAEGRIPPRDTPDRQKRERQARQALAEATLDAAHHSLVHAAVCLHLHAHLEPAADTGPVRRQVERVIRRLIATPPLAATGDLEADLDHLVSTPGWEHPASVLERPHPVLGELLAACRSRIEKVADETERRHLAEVEAKLLRAQRIEESARRRRWQRAFAAFVGIEPPPDDEA